MRGPSSRRCFNACGCCTCCMCVDPHVAIVLSCIFWSLFMKSFRIRNMSDCLPCRKSCHGGNFSKAVISKLSERVKATKGRPCFDAGRKRLLPAKCITVPSLIVRPCDFWIVRAKPADTGNCVRVMRVPALIAVIGKIGTHFGSSV